MQKEKKTKIIKTILICIFCVIVLAIGYIGFVFYGIITAHQSIVETAHAYEPYTLKSYDGEYLLQTVKTEEATGVYVSFFVTDKEERVCFQCPDQYRAMDLKSILWNDDSWDITVVSGDVGTYQYVYQHAGEESDAVDIWIREPVEKLNN